MRTTFDDRLWSEGTIGIPTPAGEDKKITVCKYWVKHYDEPSVYGIDEGRISKLEIRIDGETTCAYDRGWVIEPDENDPATELALAILMHEYN